MKFEDAFLYAWPRFLSVALALSVGAVVWTLLS